MARSRVGLEAGDELLELFDGTKDVEGFDIFECGFEVSPEGRDTSVAALEFREVVITNHSVEEASGELGHHEEVELRQCFWGFGPNGTYSEGKGISCVLASLEVIIRTPVGLHCINVSLDLRAVEKPVLSNGLRELSGISEDLRP